MIEIVIIWTLLSVVAGVVAENKGRSGVGFFFLSMVLSPLIGIIGAAVARPDQDTIERRQLSSGRYRRCPQCAELVRAEAQRCRFCGAALGQANLGAGPPAGAGGD